MGPPTPFEAAVNCAVDRTKIVEHPVIKEVVNDEESEIGALIGAASTIKSLAEHVDIDSNCAAWGAIVGEVIGRESVTHRGASVRAKESGVSREVRRQQAVRDRTFEDLSFFGALAIHKCVVMESRKDDLLSMGQVLLDTVADSELVHR